MVSLENSSPGCRCSTTSCGQLGVGWLVCGHTIVVIIPVLFRIILIEWLIWQPDHHGGTAAWCFLVPDRAVVLGDNACHNGQAETAAAGITVPRGVSAIKTLEDFLRVFGGNPGAVVTDLDHRFGQRPVG